MRENEPLCSAGQIIPLRDHSRAEALQYLLFFLHEDGKPIRCVGLWPKGEELGFPVEEAVSRWSKATVSASRSGSGRSSDA